jgi:hypothetical protein
MVAATARQRQLMSLGIEFGIVEVDTQKLQIDLS